MFAIAHNLAAVDEHIANGGSLERKHDVIEQRFLSRAGQRGIVQIDGKKSRAARVQAGRTRFSSACKQAARERIVLGKDHALKLVHSQMIFELACVLKNIDLNIAIRAEA